MNRLKLLILTLLHLTLNVSYAQNYQAGISTPSKDYVSWKGSESSSSEQDWRGLRSYHEGDKTGEANWLIERFKKSYVEELPLKVLSVNEKLKKYILNASDNEEHISSLLQEYLLNEDNFTLVLGLETDYYIHPGSKYFYKKGDFDKYVPDFYLSLATGKPFHVQRSLIGGNSKAKAVWEQMKYESRLTIIQREYDEILDDLFETYVKRSQDKIQRYLETHDYIDTIIPDANAKNVNQVSETELAKNDLLDEQDSEVVDEAKVIKSLRE